MDKNTFIEKLFDLLKKQFGEEVTITQKKIEKSNGISYEGFTIKKKMEYISPVISIDNCYEDYSAGSSLDEIMKEIVHQYEESTRNNPFLSAQDIQNYEKIKDRLYMQVVNIPEIMTFKECQKILKVGKNTLLDLIHTNQLEAFKVGSRWKIPKQSVIEFIQYR